MTITEEIALGIMHLAQVKRKIRVDLKDIRRNLREGGEKASETNMNAIVDIIASTEYYTVKEDTFQKCYYISYAR
jgi:hypothetical protein